MLRGRSDGEVDDIPSLLVDTRGGHRLIELVSCRLHGHVHAACAERRTWAEGTVVGGVHILT